MMVFFKLLVGVSSPIPLPPLWRKVVVDSTKKNHKTELIQAGECLTKQNFI